MSNSEILWALGLGTLVLFRKKLIPDTARFVNPFLGEQSRKLFDIAVADGVPGGIAAMMVGQAKHESNNYRSNFAVKFRNFIGYVYDPNSKYQIGKGTNEAGNPIPIGVYKSGEDSFRELIDWVQRRQQSSKFPKDLNEIKTVLQYATLLQRSGYYGPNSANPMSTEKAIQLYAAGIERGMASIKI